MGYSQVVEGLEYLAKKLDLYSVDHAVSIILPIFEKGINATVFWGANLGHSRHRVE